MQRLNLILTASGFEKVQFSLFPAFFFFFSSFSFFVYRVLLDILPEEIGNLILKIFIVGIRNSIFIYSEDLL